MKYEYIFTLSVDGFIKFWKKVQGGIEFVKTFRAHLGKISGAALSCNETRLATVSSLDSALKVFDVTNFDLMHMIKLKFIPDICEFIHKKSSFSALLAIAE
jgi:peptidylprolyl isomerase domain and WD repeat-containing protein 1